MEINKQIRIDAVKRIIKKCESIQSKLSPYGHGDPMKYYYLIDYWEEVLHTLNHGK